MAVQNPRKEYEDMIRRNMSNMDRSVNQQPFQFQAPAQFSYNPQTDPAYQSALQQARQNLAIDQGNTNAFLSARGQGRSSYSEQIANQLANQSNERIATSVLPQYMQQAYQRFADDANRNLQVQQLNYGAQQDQLRNLSNVINTAAQQSQRGFDNDMAMRDYALREANVTGHLRNPELTALYQAVIDQKNRWETGSPEDRAAAEAEANRLRQQIAMMGGNPEIVDRTVTLQDATRNVGQQGGIPTQAYQQFMYQQQRDQVGDQRYDQQFAYQQARDAIADERWKLQFDEDVRRYGIDSALQRQVQLGNLDIARMNAATSRMSAQNSAGNAAHGRLMDIWQATGRAPAGIPGVAEGTPYGQQQAAQQMGPNDYKMNPEFASDYSYIVNNPEEAKKILTQNADAFIQSYGFDGYRALISGLPKEDQNIADRILMNYYMENSGR